MPLVFFDFDGTLTTRDTIRPLASSLCASLGRSGRSLASVQLSLLLLKLRLRSNHSFKQQFARLLLAGESVERIRDAASRFHAAHLESILCSPVVELLREHTEAGDDVYLVSSNFEFFLQPLERRWNLKGILATRTEVIDGRFTGRLLGRACDGREKLARVVSAFGEPRVREAVAYGDSFSDSFLLDFVRTSHWVGPRQAPRPARFSAAA